MYHNDNVVLTPENLAAGVIVEKIENSSEDDVIALVSKQRWNENNDSWFIDIDVYFKIAGSWYTYDADSSDPSEHVFSYNDESVNIIATERDNAQIVLIDGEHFNLPEPRTVTTEKEIRNLPRGSVLRGTTSRSENIYFMQYGANNIINIQEGFVGGTLNFDYLTSPLYFPHGLQVLFETKGAD